MSNERPRPDLRKYINEFERRIRSVQARRNNDQTQEEKDLIQERGNALKRKFRMFDQKYKLFKERRSDSEVLFTAMFAESDSQGGLQILLPTSKPTRADYAPIFSRFMRKLSPDIASSPQLAEYIDSKSGCPIKLTQYQLNTRFGDSTLSIRNYFNNDGSGPIRVEWVCMRKAPEQIVGDAFAQRPQLVTRSHAGSASSLRR